IHHSPFTIHHPPSTNQPLTTIHHPLMITSDREQQIKLQFLEEATDYLETIESGLLGLGTGKVTGKQLDALLRAAHSIKGGAAMMGFTTLASLGHHLEDYFKIIQYGKSVPPDAEIETLMLGTIDKLRQIIALNRQGQDADNGWLNTQVNPIFDRLRERLGDFNPEDEASMLASESGEDVLTFLFESEVERSLTQLEETIAASSNDPNSIYENLVTSAEDLGGFAEMVELPALGQLCDSILAQIKAQPHQIRSIADLAIAAWRRTQSMVLIGRIENLPIAIELPQLDTSIFPAAETIRDFQQFKDNFITQPEISIHELETVPDREDINLSQTITDFSEENIVQDNLTIFENVDDVNEFQIFINSDLDAFTTIEDDFDELSSQFATQVEIDNTITYESEEREPIANLAQRQTVSEFDNPELTSDLFNQFDSIDLTSDLFFDSEVPEVFSTLAGLFGDLEPAETTSKPKIDRLDREAVELFSALDAAPEAANDAAHSRHNNHDSTSRQSPVQTAEQTIRVAIGQLQEIGDLFGELTIDRSRLDLNLQGLRQSILNLQLKVKQLEQSNSNFRSAYDNVSGKPQKIETTNSSINNYANELDLLEFDRYDENHLLAQEMIDNIIQIAELTTDLDIQINDTERSNRDLNRTAKQLQTGLTQVRMRPISDLFNRFPRAIRDLSTEHAKLIDLQLKGGSTQIDRSILEALNDPLMHLVRNAFDHGIESSAIRRDSGKSDIGTIEINATYRGDRTIITIKDDGGGIDLDKIRAKVKKMGMSDVEIANFKDNELIDLIFEPGFSTAAKVTDLSGRGVGMDVVRTNIRSLQGDVSVSTKLGKGTTFTITVPFTLSVIRILLVEVNSMWLAIPSNVVEEIMLLDRDRIISTAGQKILQWENFSIRLIQPANYLHIPHFSSQLTTFASPTIDRSTVLTIDRGQDVVALEIDKFWGEQEVTIRQPQDNVKMPTGFTGCTILGDGRIVPLLDPIELIDWIDNNLSGSLDPNPDTPALLSITPTPKSRILVIDDSINVRRFVALTLEKSGYLVEQAKDGQEAVEKLQAGLVVQAAICDIEMPRMDGYGFLTTIKDLTPFKNIPVLMLTSRSSDKHRKIAMNLGASGYFSKPFKEQELLNTLTQLIGK
ncbi:response regulator, partial [Chamaesiphon sp.]|uniref:hybrid sensor histidine kinase/response regulator n=1 Tax=Chamaesiphon sp. TaxID=2814140 RepID=UPI003593FF66